MSKHPTKRTTPLSVRLFGGMLGAGVIVLALSLTAAFLIRMFSAEQERGIVLHPVGLMSGYNALDLAEVMGEPRHKMPELAPPPPATPLPERTVTGYVLLEVTVDAQGEAVSAKVLESAPAGLYEQRAIDEALAQPYPAGNAGVRDAFIRFNVPAPNEKSAD